jgi:hypothetical protein
MISWPVLNGRLIGKVLRASSWDSSPGVIADPTRSGKLKVRADHIKTADAFTIVMYMPLEEYRVFDDWWRYTDRKGVYTFAYPKINNNTGEQAEYQFIPGAKLGVKNIAALHMEVSMAWQEVL